MAGVNGEGKGRGRAKKKREGKANEHPLLSPVFPSLNKNRVSIAEKLISGIKIKFLAWKIASLG